MSCKSVLLNNTKDAYLNLVNKMSILEFIAFLVKIRSQFMKRLML